MQKYLLLLLLFPSVISAQERKPVTPHESKDYLDLVRKDLATKELILADSSHNAREANLLVKGKFYTGIAIKKVVVTQNDVLKVYRKTIRVLAFGGIYSSSAEIRTINRLPQLQKTFVQGRPENGQLQWRGPETGELFSYGPAISQFEFDGSPYAYDINGRLVNKGLGNGKQAIAYPNSIFRTAFLHSHSFTLLSNYYIDYKNVLNTTIKVGQTRENTFIKHNKNSSGNFTASVTATLRKIGISGSYSYLRDRFSNANRNGFLNRVYQNALLTPVSFDNSQATTLGVTQRSYSNLADNPLFLLEDNGNSLIQTSHRGGLTLESKQGKLKLKLTQSLESNDESGREVYKPGTAYFPAGIFTSRIKTDRSYYIRFEPTYPISYSNSDFKSTLSGNYNFTAANSKISYSINPTRYAYQRSSHDISTRFSTLFSHYDIHAGLDAGNKFYFSNTSRRNNYFLPSVSGFVRFANIFDHIEVKLVSTLSHFNSELPISQSHAHINLLRYTVQDAFQYFPTTEVTGFDNLQPIGHREWTGRIELEYDYKISLSAEVFVRRRKNDVFAVHENGNLVLRNIADHRNKGLEIDLTINQYRYQSDKIHSRHSISFITWNNKVTGVRDGYDYTPIAGFANVHKAIVKGKTLGAIVGNVYSRDGYGNKIIGAEGFPLVDPQLKVIGDPLPDFIMKMNNDINWKKLSLHIDWQWRKGGEAWNGTEAALDYYGRSATSAALRNTTGYVFTGISESGHPNEIPVNFHDPSLPLDKNRWVRYGVSGVAEEYIRKTDQLWLQGITLGYTIFFRKYIQKINLSAYVNNLLIWSAYKGADPSSRLLYDQPVSSGLDFFNLPATKTFGLSATIQF